MPPRRTTPQGYENARNNRKNPTPAERKLWSHLKDRQVNGVKFRRQHAIGNYIPDFCAVKEKLIIELDGSQHLEQTGYDEERTKYFESLGYRVIRFWNNQVTKELDNVILAIIHALEDNTKGNA
ncbi:MAG: endonuclease domain-containing protein [Anaerolineales bacterium]|nr:endonuclease domain-containing protein [Anaerolineales bacterium]